MCGVGTQAVATVGVSLLAWLASTGLAQESAGDVATELDAGRLIGKAHYENDKFAEAANEFQRCIKLAPGSAVDHFNLGLVFMRATKYEDSLRVLGRARQLDPDLLGVYYIEGIIYQRQAEHDKAAERLLYVIERDRQCLGAHYNLGVCYKFLQRYDDAVSAFKKAVEIAPQHPSSHYQLITLYRRLGQVDNAQIHREIFDQVKDTIDESERTAEALERSQYTYILEAPRLTRDLTPRPEARIKFVDVTGNAGLRRVVTPATAAAVISERVERTAYDPTAARERYVAAVGGAVTLGDCDGDGDLDIYVVNCSAAPRDSVNRLYRNEGRGRFADVTDSAGVGDAHPGMDAVWGDYDNDGHNDLYVVNDGPNVLYHNKEDGTFENVSQTAKVDEPHFGAQAVFVDYDHDNDLDIFVGNCVDFTHPPDAESFSVPNDLPGQINSLLRNNGNGTFTDQTDEAGLLVDRAQTVAVTFTDFDADHDVDLLLGNVDRPVQLFSNARMGKFTSEGSFSPSIEGNVHAFGAGDFDRDSHPDLLVAMRKHLYLYMNDGRAHFSGKRIDIPLEMTGTGVGRFEVFDYNNDGWSDLLLASGDGRTLALLAGGGVGRFVDVTASAGLDAFHGLVVDLTCGDLDGDGAEEIVLQTRDRGPVILKNDTQDAGHWIGVHLVGKRVNKNGFGAVVEIAAGGHYQRQTVREDLVHFGIGDLEGIDVIRVTWPNGVAQNVIRPKINEIVTIEEYVKVSASCAFLYAYNGVRFELVNEILGIGPLGVPMSPGVYYPLDNTELTKIATHQLAPREGLYELRLTEELREITYADQISLRVVDHPSELEIIPNEMFSSPPPEDKFFAVADRRPPVSAVDDRGIDVLSLVLERDGRFPTFGLVKQYDGLAEPHALTLDLGDLSGAEQFILFLDSWIYWPESSVGVAIGQDPRFEIAPLRLEVRNEQGHWETAIQSVGLPTSKGLVVPVDLTGQFLCDDHRVRLSTNMRIYFDRIFVSTYDEATRCRVTELPVAHARLHYRGFSRMTRDGFGFERFNYDEVSPTGSWNPPAGFFTRYADVTTLLERPDDMYVIFGPGDELVLQFDATHLPDLPAGRVRDFIFYADGWVKDGDLNTKYSETVTPLPFHGMSGYPYPATERYPDTPEHQLYLRSFNTRPSRSTVGRLSSAD